MSSLNLGQLHRDLETATTTRDRIQKETVGLWCETFTADVSRLETNYSGLDCLPGLARLPGTQTVAHELTGYWGAARDRIPDSGWDNFSQDRNPESHHAGHGRDISMSDDREGPEWRGKTLTGTNPHNLVYIRSGQFWANCEEAERRLYEERLEPTLRKGLAYLWENLDESGAMALRYLSTTNSGFTPSSSSSSPSSSTSSSPTPAQTSEGQSRESCVTGFFRNLTDLESWAKQHASHLAIYTGALRHAKTFGDKRRFRTWHEVAVLRGGEARFEYVNCPPGTGVMGCRAIMLKEVGP
ncbi:heme-containing dehydratase protein [Aspergillus taichungensis]|uniref:Heme-containing dehydratase protein n=1 Tax=Aspergillus taichungensis TaxID=482145 RepID=A0A2J5I4R0_9EURO|nr:heme-containing dehydratase protein [Aspergillus taichungensis]